MLAKGETYAIRAACHDCVRLLGDVMGWVRVGLEKVNGAATTAVSLDEAKYAEGE